MGLKTIELTLTGATGTAYTDGPVYGFVECIRLEYTDIANATTDVTISEEGDPSRDIMTISNSNTDATYQPHVSMQDSTGSDTGLYRMPYISGQRLKMAATQSDAGTITAFINLIEV
jgi:hypothetical protein